jgi:hypothetical protein
MLHQKMLGFVKTKLAKIKENPEIDREEGFKVLEELHQMARKAANGAMLELCSALSLLVVRILAYRYPDSAKPTQTAVIPTPAKKNKKAKTDSVQDDGKSQLSSIAQVYYGSLSNFIVNRKSRLQISFFVDFATRFVHLATELIAPALEEVAAGQAENGYKVVQAFAFAAQVAKRLPTKVWRRLFFS